MATDAVTFTDRERRLMERVKRRGGRRVWVQLVVLLILGGTFAAIGGWIGFQIIGEDPFTPAEIALIEKATARLAEADLLLEADNYAAGVIDTRGDAALGFWWGVAAGGFGFFSLLSFGNAVHFLLYLIHVGSVARQYRLARKLIAVFEASEANVVRRGD